MDPHFPTIDSESLYEIISNGSKVRQLVIGSTTTIVLDGKKSISESIVNIRHGFELDFNYATSMAKKAGAFGGLLDWYEKHKNWKDGGYFVPNKSDETAS